MNLKILEKSLLPLFLATILLVAFIWQFTYVYTFLIEQGTEEKLSSLYAQLFIYVLLALTLFLFLTNTVNCFLKSKLFMATTSFVVLIFYGISHNVVMNPIQYFIDYPLSNNELMFMILFIVSTLIYALYSLSIIFVNKPMPFLHSLVFLIIGISYSLWFIESYAYPISTLFSKYSI